MSALKSECVRLIGDNCHDVEVVARCVKKSLQQRAGAGYEHDDTCSHG
jgi:hypothetical protein